MNFCLNRVLLVFLVTLLIACGGGGGSSGGSSNPGGDGETGVAEPEPEPGSATVVGRVTYDRVSHDTGTSGLNYDAIEILPVRGAVVQLTNSMGSVLEETLTDDEGFYQFRTDREINVRVQVRAETESPAAGTASWNVRVGDNTSGGALYVLQGSLLPMDEENSTRNLHAPSGWSSTLNRYSQTRVAAPFAILDSIYSAIQAFVAVDETVQFPGLEVFWSVNNMPTPVQGDLSEGEIATSFYSPGQNRIYILGAENNDTDEYDRHVIVHEWGHYFEAQLSRSDSIGGSHSVTSVLDMRVAFGEGWGNALSGMVLDDSVYRDSSRAAQSRGFSINVEANDIANEFPGVDINMDGFSDIPAFPGWFTEASVQSILYDIYDSDDDGSDSISAGLGPIYDVLTSASYVNSPLFTSAHLFLDAIKNRLPASAAQIDTLAAFQDITVSDALGSTETNDGGGSDVLPIYTDLSVGGIQEVCVSYDFGVSENNNTLGNRRYLRVLGLSEDFYTITVSRSSGSDSTDPDFVIYRQPDFAAMGQSETVNLEQAGGTLDAGDYLIEVFNFNQANACFNVSISN